MNELAVEGLSNAPEPCLDSGASKPSDLTGLLTEWANGDQCAGEALLEVIYADLRAMAARYVQGERRDITLQPTALVHEAYLRLVDQNRASWRNRSQFFAVASQMMRRILVDHARGRLSLKRGGGQVQVSLTQADRFFGENSTQLLAIDDALCELASVDPQKAKIVELRFFGGFQFQEIARHLEISTATLNRQWRIARIWLYSHLHPDT